MDNAIDYIEEAMRNVDDCIAWLDRLNKIAWDYLQTHVAYFDSIDAWTWDSHSGTIDILYTGDNWESRCLTVSLKYLLEWADEHCRERRKTNSSPATLLPGGSVQALSTGSVV